MFQTFTATATPEQGPPRLAALRGVMARHQLDGFLIPRADAYQGEYVAACDARLAWLTGFTGSAGFCTALTHSAGVFIDGRYRTQVKGQVAADFTPVPWPETSLADWLKQELPKGGTVGFDPWLHTVSEIARTTQALENTGITLTRSKNLIDQIWTDRPAPPMAPVVAHPIAFAGETADSKLTRLAGDLQQTGHHAAVITQPESIMWLLNIRGGDVEHTPLAHCMAILHADASVDLFIAAGKLGTLTPPLPDPVQIHAPDTLLDQIDALTGPVRIDPITAPQILADQLGDQAVHGPDPCALPKARKNPAEIDGAAQAHLRDGAAVVELLAWLDAAQPGTLREIDVVRQLEHFRRADNSLKEISFDTISGTGPNGAIMHYRVTEDSNATLQDGHLLVLDSGGQYLDGTTDITRTIAIGTPGDDERAAFTRVLQGMIAMSRLRWPVGLSGREIECIGRLPLWLAGQDFNHGLGHGVGAYLGVHEGPQRLARSSDIPLEPGMILSNEPGYYREGAFGIRIENLIVVEQAPPLPGGDPERQFLTWRTLTYVPIDRRLIVTDMLGSEDRAWLNAYHARVLAQIRPRVSQAAQLWLDAATAPL